MKCMRTVTIPAHSLVCNETHTETFQAYGQMRIGHKILLSLSLRFSTKIHI